MINKTIIQRLNELELNEPRLEASKHEKVRNLLDPLVVFAKQEKDKGNRTFWQILEKWAKGEATTQEKHDLFKAMRKANPSWNRELEGLL